MFRARSLQCVSIARGLVTKRAFSVTPAVSAAAAADAVSRPSDSARGPNILQKAMLEVYGDFEKKYAHLLDFNVSGQELLAKSKLPEAQKAKILEECHQLTRARMAEFTDVDVNSKEYQYLKAQGLVD
eukprot:TRINITY_DN14312_c0_g1_i1.p1 TRINITY_DN14312_c0_g1~~TRINITY_DN14312_c0_g1_i1.p1  ORF type:complete len:128 (-),score=16.72 TRINITY_DN14312_c0_g1_i1:196-579(-)